MHGKNSGRPEGTALCALAKNLMFVFKTILVVVAGSSRNVGELRLVIFVTLHVVVLNQVLDT